MTTDTPPGPLLKHHAGMDYRILLKPDDSCVYLDIDKLGLHQHQVHTNSHANQWNELIEKGERTAATIIDLHNAAPKELL
jgi:hypothetical protein